MSGLKTLKEEENRIFLVLVIWLITGFTVIQFSQGWGIILFAPLLFLCVILFTVAFILRKNVKDMGGKSILKYILISIPFIILFSSLMAYLFIFMVIISILSYIFIVAVFSMNSLYQKSIKFDEKLYNWPTPINFIARSAVFGGGLLISVVLMLFFAGAGTIMPLAVKEMPNFFSVIPWLMIGVFLLLATITFIFLLKGKYNAWIGVFFVWISLFAFYLLFKTVYSVTSAGGESTYGLPIQIALYIFDLFLVLFTLGKLIGDQADIVSKKTKYLNSDAILIWLIFSKATYEFLNAFEGTGVSVLKSVGSFALFVPLFLYMGLRGIYKYSEIKKRRKKKKKAKKRKGLSLIKSEKRQEEKGIQEGNVYCSKCGTANAQGSIFCKKCGNEL
ncbi:MAG: zinc ribbon domain-containing protein [Promethearchaeia archaeon]